MEPVANKLVVWNSAWVHLKKSKPSLGPSDLPLLCENIVRDLEELHACATRGVLEGMTKFADYSPYLTAGPFWSLLSQVDHDPASDSSPMREECFQAALARFRKHLSPPRKTYAAKKSKKSGFVTLGADGAEFPLSEDHLAWQRLWGIGFKGHSQAAERELTKITLEFHLIRLLAELDQVNHLCSLWPSKQDLPNLTSLLDASEHRRFAELVLGQLGFSPSSAVRCATLLPFPGLVFSEILQPRIRKGIGLLISLDEIPNMPTHFIPSLQMKRGALEVTPGSIARVLCEWSVQQSSTEKWPEFLGSKPQPEDQEDLASSIRSFFKELIRQPPHHPLYPISAIPPIIAKAIEHIARHGIPHPSSIQDSRHVAAHTRWIREAIDGPEHHAERIIGDIQEILKRAASGELNGGAPDTIYQPILVQRRHWKGLTLCSPDQIQAACPKRSEWLTACFDHFRYVRRMPIITFDLQPADDPAVYLALHHGSHLPVRQDQVASQRVWGIGYRTSIDIFDHELEIYCLSEALDNLIRDLKSVNRLCESWHRRPEYFNTVSFTHDRKGNLFESLICDALNIQHRNVARTSLWRDVMWWCDLRIMCPGVLNGLPVQVKFIWNQAVHSIAARNRHAGETILISPLTIARHLENDFKPEAYGIEWTDFLGIFPDQVVETESLAYAIYNYFDRLIVSIPNHPLGPAANIHPALLRAIHRLVAQSGMRVLCGSSESTRVGPASDHPDKPASLPEIIL